MLAGVSTLNANCVVQAVQTGNERRLSLYLWLFVACNRRQQLECQICLMQAIQTGNELLVAC